MSEKAQKKKVKKLAAAMQACSISTADAKQNSQTSPAEDLDKELEFHDILDPKLLAKWPKPESKVPGIFLHKTADFAAHSKNLLELGINFYQPYLGTNYTRIFCVGFNDHRAMVQYFDEHDLPFHTFGHPNKKKIKVVIRGLPNNTDLDKLHKAMKAADIPIVRMHKMHMKDFAKDRDILVLAVVPYNHDKGKKLLQLKKAFGHPVIVEPPLPKVSQCHRCQKWGHSQRYCHGLQKCVKCAGDHVSQKCTKDPEEPPTCANCGGNHTASYRECFYCPDSTEYKHNKRNKVNRMIVGPSPKRVVVTMENSDNLYRKIKNIPNHDEAVPF